MEGTYHIDLVQVVTLTGVHKELPIDVNTFLFALLEVPTSRNEFFQIVLDFGLDLLKVLQFVQNSRLILDVRRRCRLRPLGN